MKVKLLGREEKTVSVKGNDTVQSLKKQLGLDAAATCLLFGGKPLADKQTLQACKVKAGETIHAVRVLPAGTSAVPAGESKCSQ